MKKKPRKPTSLEAQAKAAMAVVDSLAASLPLDRVTVRAAGNAGRRAGRVPRAAVEIARTLIEDAPERFEPFDASTLRDAAAYERAMRPLADALIRLGEQITRTIKNRNGEAAYQTLAFYQWLKGVSRRSAGLSVPTQSLKKLLTRNRKRRATSVTKKEVRAMKKGARLEKVAAAKRARVAKLAG